MTLKNTSVCISFPKFKEKLTDFGCKELPHLKLDIFMKAKKSHEVEVLSGVAAVIKQISNTSHLIDIGDGKGYLSSMLALHYKIPVLGIDASETNTNGAVDRANKLSRVWNGVVTNVKTRETSISLYRQITKYVDDQLDFFELVSNVFLESPKKLGLVGLHTCGNLTPTCLKIFHENQHIKTICNVGCCYHHLTEQFEPQTEKNNYNCLQVGFPLSQYLTEKKCFVNRGARMVAAQSVDRILYKKERPSRSMFYRGLFEVIIDKYCEDKSISESHVGRFRKESPNFLDYVKQAAKRIQFPLQLADNEINDIYAKYEDRIDEMDFFYLVRSMLAPVVETLILLDRLLYLYEKGYKNSFLVQFFDPVLSPRCYGIVSIKE